MSETIFSKCSVENLAGVQVRVEEITLRALNFKDMRNLSNMELHLIKAIETLSNGYIQALEELSNRVNKGAKR